MTEWKTYRKKTNIKAKRIENLYDLDASPDWPDSCWSERSRDGFRLDTREGETDTLPYPYYVATDGKDYWPIAPDFMDENYEEVPE